MYNANKHPSVSAMKANYITLISSTIGLTSLRTEHWDFLNEIELQADLLLKEEADLNAHHAFGDNTAMYDDDPNRPFLPEPPAAYTETDEPVLTFVPAAARPSWEDMMSPPPFDDVMSPDAPAKGVAHASVTPDDTTADSGIVDTIQTRPVGGKNSPQSRGGEPSFDTSPPPGAPDYTVLTKDLSKDIANQVDDAIRDSAVPR